MTAKKIPAGASQHITAGPYSPVLEVVCSKMVVISGQVAVDPQGATIGADISTQTRAALDNCKRQLATANCTLSDVFKVNIFMKDLSQWDKMNQVYSDYMPEPRPVRTAVQAVLMADYLVEIEMWAAKPDDAS